ncbi:MAG: carbon storage regulator CsrA [Candidatus Cybelea sp.]
MLVLSRKANQSIMIGSDIRIIVVGVDRDQVKLGIDAPRDVPVHRLEIFTEIHRGDGEAISSGALSPVGNPVAQGDITGGADRE